MIHKGWRPWEVLGTACVAAGIVTLFVVTDPRLQLFGGALIVVGFIWLLVRPDP